MEAILGSFARGTVGLSEALRREASGSEFGAVAAPLLERHGPLVIALKGRPRIGTEPFGPNTLRAIGTAYRDKGAACLDRLRGPFALAVLDQQGGNVLLAVDRLGIETLAWTAEDDVLHFGTSTAAVAARSTRPVTVSNQALFDFMLSHMVPGPDSVYVGVEKLLGGTCLTLREGRIDVRRYWEPSFARDNTAHVGALQSAVLPTLERAIAHCEPSERTGTFLSGGLDSSTVTGLYSRSRGGAIDAFSVGFGVDDFNELAFARTAVAQFGCRHHVYEVVPTDIVEQIPRIAAAYDEPFGNSSAVPTFCCARLAKSHGIDHLLAGDGGDEIFGGNSRYVRQNVFEVYGRLPRWLRTAIAEPLADRLDPETAPLPLRKFSSYVRQARVPLPERFESWNMIYREGPAKVFDADFLAAVDQQHPLRRMREAWESCPSNDLLDQMLWYDWKLTLTDSDLRKVSQMCELAGVRASYPMLDEEFVDLSIAVPSNEKIRGKELRTFFKNAVRGFLPAEIIAKKKHGFGLPFGVWLKTDRRLQELVYGDLESLRQRHIVAAEFVDRVAEEHRTGHAGYYGYAIWDMIMLEQWLRAHIDRPRTA